MSDKTRINFVSNQNVHVPGLFQWCMTIDSDSIQPDARDVAARMFMMADLFPALTGSELKRVAEEELKAEIDEEAGTVSFTVERGER